MKFFCKDIQSGEQVKILNAENNRVDSVHFGVEPTDQTIKDINMVRLNVVIIKDVNVVRMVRKNVRGVLDF